VSKDKNLLANAKQRRQAALDIDDDDKKKIKSERVK
jgi:hypothetical protein